MIKIASPRPLLAAAAITACLLAAGCSSKAATAAPPARSHSSSATQGSATSQTAAATTITIKNFGYTVSGPAAPGSTVQVTNNDSETHSVTADTDNTFDVTIQPGKTATFTAPTATGSYKFHCMFHSNMHAALTVTK